jgi:hypothetical protein
MDTIPILIGVVLGVLAASKSEQARLQRILSMGKKNIGTFDLKLKGKNIITAIKDFGLSDITIGNNKFVNNPDRVYLKGGVPHACGNEGSTELIDLDAQMRKEKVEVVCGECGAKLEVEVQNIHPIPDTKVYNDIVLRAISWGMTVLQDKRTQLILLAVGGAILVGLASAFFGYINMQAAGTANNKLDAVAVICQACANVTKAVK